LARAAEHVKKQLTKPHDQRPRPPANRSVKNDLSAEHDKKQSMKPNDRRARPPANGSHVDLNAISNSTSSPAVTVVEKQTDIVALRTPAAANGISDVRPANAGLMSFSPLAMLLRQQDLMTSVMLNVMQTQQHWARALCRLP